MKLLQLLTTSVSKFSVEDYRKNWKSFLINREVKHRSIFRKPSILFHTLVTFVDAEDVMNEKILSSETYDTNAGILCTQTTDPNNKVMPQFQKNCVKWQKLNQTVPNCFQKQREEGKRKRNSSQVWSKLPVKSFKRNFNSYRNWILPTDRIPGIDQNQQIDILDINSLVSYQLQFQVIERKVLVPDIFIVKEDSVPIELHHVQVTLFFIDKQKTVDLLKILFSEIIVIDLLLDITLLDSNSKNTILHIDLYWDNVQDLRRHFEVLLIIHKRNPLETMIMTVKKF